MPVSSFRGSPIGPLQSISTCEFKKKNNNNNNSNELTSLERALCKTEWQQSDYFDYFVIVFTATYCSSRERFYARQCSKQAVVTGGFPPPPNPVQALMSTHIEGNSPTARRFFTEVCQLTLTRSQAVNMVPNRKICIQTLNKNKL